MNVSPMSEIEIIPNTILKCPIIGMYHCSYTAGKQAVLLLSEFKQYHHFGILLFIVTATRHWFVSVGTCLDDHTDSQPV